ncbi:hypothetical protein GFK82_00362 [Candidatus Steffania adelgidicola]|nr:hypothetical protein GFK82_00362 [Candidatus Steffania adelgidicola]
MILTISDALLSIWIAISDVKKIAWHEPSDSFIFEKAGMVFFCSLFFKKRIVLLKKFYLIKLIAFTKTFVIKIIRYFPV